ncbi:MAG: cold shock domain-containing protein [Bradyrhizobium sp.]
MIGEVKRFNSERSFGFIKLADGGGDVFFHMTELKKGGIHNISVGEVLEFAVGASERHPGKQCAVDVRRVGAEPLSVPRAARKSPRPAAADDDDFDGARRRAAEAMGMAPAK